MSASALPLELLLQIFKFLDARSFYAARKICKWWHLASSEPVTLVKLLKTLPISPSVSGVTLTPRELLCLSARASRHLMLEYRAYQEPKMHAQSGASNAAMLACGFPTSIATRARKMAVVDGQVIRVFDTSANDWRLLVQRHIDERIGGGLWLKTWPLSSFNIALASHGQLLAVAHKNSIQIYDVSTGASRCILNDSVTPVRDQSITGLEFEHNDHLLRVHLSQRGGVIYFGSPPKDGTGAEVASFEHWSGENGLQHIFLNSSLLVIDVQGNESAPIWVSGVQLLQPLRGGYLFAAQRHGGRQSSRYTLMHANCAVESTTQSLRIDPTTVVEVARLESFLSSLDYGIEGHAHHEIGGWESMPSAREANPKFGLTANGTILLLAEKETKRICATPLTQLFVYGLPGNKQIEKLLDEREAICGSKEQDVVDVPAANALLQHVIPSMPISLGTITGHVVDIATEKLGDKVPSYKVTVLTNEAAQSWRLEGA